MRIRVRAVNAAGASAWSEVTYTRARATPAPTPTPTPTPAPSGGSVIEIVVDNPVARVNGTNVTLDQSAAILNGRTVVPARFIAENLGAAVEWTA